MAGPQQQQKSPSSPEKSDRKAVALQIYCHLLAHNSGRKTLAHLALEAKEAADVFLATVNERT